MLKIVKKKNKKKKVKQSYRKRHQYILVSLNSGVLCYYVLLIPGFTHLENRVQIRILLVSAELVEGQEGKNPTRLLPCAPLLQQLLDTETLH